MRIAVVAALIAALIGIVQAEEQIGLQPGWVETSSLEVSKTGAFSRSGEQVTTSLEILSQGSPLIAYPSGDPLSTGGHFFIAHKDLRLTIRHNYPDVLPPDASAQECEIESAGVFGSYGAESEATVEECSAPSSTGGSGHIFTRYSAYGETSGLLSDLINMAKFRAGWVHVEYRYGEEDDPRPHHGAFGSTHNRLGLVASTTDLLKLTFRVSAQHSDPTTGARLPDEGLEVRVRYAVSHPDLGEMDFYISPWAETDSTGEALVDAGAGGEIIDVENPITVPAPYAIVSSGKASGYGGYATNRKRLDDMRNFKGILTVRTVDTLGRAVGNAGVSIRGAWSAHKPSDASGFAEIEIGEGGSDSENLTIALPPRLTPEGSGLAQIVDGTAANQLHSASPVYFVPRFRIVDAITYESGGGALEDLTLRIYENGVDVADIGGLRAKHEAWVTDQDRTAGNVNAYYYPVLPTADVRNFRFHVIWRDDLDEEVELVTWLTEQPVRENRVPALERPFRVHFVGIETPGVVTLRGKGVRTTWARPGNMATMKQFFQTLYPAPVEFTFGPDIESSNPWYMVGPWRVLSYFVDVARHRDSMPNRPDLIVGVTGPGVIGADGLSEPRFRNAILLDGSAMRESYLMHEYMHTLGELDNYDYETGENDRGASANGFDPRTATRVYNRPGADKPAFQTIMYDHAPNPWFTRHDYDTLLNEATVPMIYNLDGTRRKAETANARNKPDATRSAPQEVMIVGAPFMGRHVWDQFHYSLKETWPIFVDWDSAWQPDETYSPFGRALGVRLSNGQTASVHEHTQWIGGPTETALAAAPMFRIPYDPGVDSVTFQVWRQDGEIDEIQTVAFSPNPPSVSIESPSAGAQLSGNATIVFHATDPDADEQLYAWVKISNDAGATWSPVGNWFPVDTGRNEFDLPCDSLPNAADARLRVLVSDGTRSNRADVGSIQIDGYTTTPRVEARPSAIEADIPAGQTALLPVRLANTGGGELRVTLDVAALPDWLACRQAAAQDLPAGAAAEFLFDARPTTTGLFSANLQFATNDPAHAALVVPIAVQAVVGPVAPVIASLSSDPDAGGGILASDAPIRFLARELCGRNDMQGRILIYDAETETLLDTVDFETAVNTGQYIALWEAPPECLGKPLGIEARLTDPASGLADENGSEPDGWDLQMTLMQHNTPPRFTNPTGDTHATITYPGHVDIPFDAVDDEGDPISYAVRHTPDLDVKLDTEAKTIRATYLLGVDGYESTVQLIATDRWGASSGVEIDINIYWRSANYAWLVDHDSVWIEGDTKQLTIAGGNLFEHPTQVHIDARAVGAADWTRLTSLPYNQWDNTHQCYLVEYAWQLPDDDADAYELRLTLVDSSGVPDSEPSVYLFERVRQEGGRVSRIEAPERVRVGQLFAIRVHVENDSSARWSKETGHGLMPLDDTDPLTGLEAVEFPALQQIERGASTVVEMLVQAPDTPGVYRTAWQLRQGKTPFGESAEAFVGVAGNALDPLTGLSETQSCRIDADGQFWLGAFDFTAAQWQSSVDATEDRALTYALTNARWVGLYLYDYGKQSWSEGLYVYKE